MTTWRTLPWLMVLCLGLSVAGSRSIAQEDPQEDGHIALEPGETYHWIVDYSVHVNKSESCPASGPPLAMSNLSATAQWGCKAITNVGDEPAIWRVDFQTTAGDGIQQYLVQNGVERQILTAPSGRTMAMTEGEGPWLASLPFAVAPGETVTLWSEISPWTALRVDPFLAWAHLVPEADFDDDVTDRAFAIASLLAASALLTLFLLTFARLLGSVPARDYAFYFIVATLHFISSEAYLAWVFQSMPVQWAVLPVKPLEVAIFVLYYRFIASFVRAALGPHLLVRLFRRMAWAAAIIAALTLVFFMLSTSLLYMPEDQLIRLGDTVPIPDWIFSVAAFGAFRSQDFGWLILGLLSAVYAIWAIFVLLRARADGAVLFTMGAGVILVLYFLPYIQDLLGLDRVQGFLLTRGMIVGDGLVFAAAMIKQTFGLRVQRDAAMQAELAASQEKLALAESLLSAKADRERAEAMAERHRERLALTSHDMRQPLVSLQMAVADAEAAAPELGEKLASGLHYLKQVLDETVVDARPEAHATAPTQSASDFEPTPIALILQNTERMFGDEARAKGLALDVQPSDLVVATQPIALIRIVSNLVSNAVKYTDRGSVQVAARAVDDTVAIDVVDTGPGLTQDEIAAVLQDYNRGSAQDSVGEGIGLSSVLKLAAETGLALDIDSTKGQGARFSITGLPVADPSPETV